MKTQKLRVVFIGIGVMLCILLLIVVAGSMPDLSQRTALQNPEVAYMRIPVLILIELVILSAGVPLVFGLVLLRKIYKDTIFNDGTVWTLMCMGNSFFLGILPMVILFIYTELNVLGSITNVYVVLGIVIYFTAGNIFRLFAKLFENANGYKKEIDYTV